MRTSERWKILTRAPLIFLDLFLKGNYSFNYDLMPVHLKHMPWSRRINLLKSGGNLIHRRTQPWSWPTHAHLEFTNYCNLKCQVCPTGAGLLKRPPQYMKPALFKQLLDEIGPRMLTASLWAWGESLLHPHLAEMLKIIYGRGITTFLSTNGQNLDNPEVINALIKYPPTYLIVALDGITDKTNSVFRVGAKLQPALDGVRRLHELKKQKGTEVPHLHLRYIVMKHNEHEVPQLKQFAKEHYFELLTIRTLSLIDAQEGVHDKLIPENEKYRAYQYKGNQKVEKRDFLDEKAFTFPAIFVDGTVVACDQDFNAQQPLGKVSKDTTFAKVWWSRQASVVRKTIRDDYRKFSFCLNCPFRDRDVSTCSIEYHDLTKMP